MKILILVLLLFLSACRNDASQIKESSKNIPILDDSEALCIRSINMRTNLPVSEYSYGRWALNAIGITKNNIKTSFLVLDYDDDVFATREDREKWLQQGKKEEFISTKGSFRVTHDGFRNFYVDSSPALIIEYENKEGFNEALNFINGLEPKDCSYQKVPDWYIYKFKNLDQEFCMSPDGRELGEGVRQPPCTK